MIKSLGTNNDIINLITKNYLADLQVRAVKYLSVANIIETPTSFESSSAVSEEWSFT